jgi:hypothetical protein
MTNDQPDSAEAANHRVTPPGEDRRTDRRESPPGPRGAQATPGTPLSEADDWKDLPAATDLIEASQSSGQAPLSVPSGPGGTGAPQPGSSQTPATSDLNFPADAQRGGMSRERGRSGPRE